MTQRIQELQKEITNLRYQRILKGSLLDSLRDGHKNIEKVEELKKEIKFIDSLLEPMNIEFNNLHHHYSIVFDSEMLDSTGQTKTKYEITKIMHSEIDCDIDTTTERRLHTDVPNYMNLLDELARRLSYDYSNVWFKSIKKIRSKIL